ncbi:hypothetical protein ACVII1_004333 [Bradyrhizobium elkanii]|uniref:hypothetical protein n=1 Tax=Bradyrhizobium elkanii TaxID=29448 RepID=UPI0035115508
MFIRPIVALVFAVSMFNVGLASADQRSQSLSHIRIAQEKTTCPQVIHCGTKNGIVKEYPTRCAAEEDGATNIAPKTGPTCPAAQ